MATRPCAHCNQYWPRRGRVCRRCLAIPGLAARYPTGPRAARGLALGNVEPPPPAEPCPHLPGSVGKLECLCERARAGTGLFHPLDGLV